MINLFTHYAVSLLSYGKNDGLLLLSTRTMAIASKNRVYNKVNNISTSLIAAMPSWRSHSLCNASRVTTWQTGMQRVGATIGLRDANGRRHSLYHPYLQRVMQEYAPKISVVGLVRSRGGICLRGTNRAKCGAQGWPEM
jgi:hypothetical protein